VTVDGSSLKGQGARRYAMVILAIVYMFNFVDRQILAILLPQIRNEFGTSDAYLGFLSGTAFALFYVTLGVPIAQYADRCNRRNLIAASVALWSAMTAVSGLAANIWHLTAARIGVGIGEAGCSPPAHSMIADCRRLGCAEHRLARGFFCCGHSRSGARGGRPLHCSGARAWCVGKQDDEWAATTPV